MSYVRPRSLDWKEPRPEPTEWVCDRCGERCEPWHLCDDEAET